VREHAGPGVRCIDDKATFPMLRSAIGCVFFEVAEVVSERYGSETLCSAIETVLLALWFNFDHTLSEAFGVVLERTSSGHQGAAIGVES
jgi:hypothetical protein